MLKSAYEIFYDKMLMIFFTPEIIRIFFYLKEEKFTYNEEIFNQDERANNLFFLAKGRANFFTRHGSSNTKIYETSHSGNELLGHFEVFAN